MADTTQERTEQPTPKRLEEARRHGQVPRSPELTTAAVVLLVGIGLHFFGSRTAAALSGLMQADLALPREQALDAAWLMPSLGTSLLRALDALAPILGLTLVAALIAPLTLGGWNFSFEALVPDFTRLSPLNGVQRIFSLRSLVELAKAFAKFLLIGAVAVGFLRQHANGLLALGAEPLHTAIADAAALGSSALLALSAALAVIAAADVPWQFWNHRQRLRMTRQEVREELRESEGSPELKGRIRRAQQEAAKRRMMQEVPKADVVVVNPTHFAVALRYEEQRMRAPIVVAKGADEVAARIREVALEHGVPIFQAPPLARALHRAVPLGGEIPLALYVAMAQVLTYVYQLRTARRTGAVPPVPPSLDPVPEEAEETPAAPEAPDDLDTRH
ncbi:MAG TPA: flagellar biosynthesis protein FlhB [Steroidobacteraceae bacterium]|nr:flagellar biosynthesis protein FlhB [Steroidobacteraceae bacterium]